MKKIRVWSCGPGLTSWCAYKRADEPPEKCPKCGGRIIVEEVMEVNE